MFASHFGARSMSRPSAVIQGCRPDPFFTRPSVHVFSPNLWQRREPALSTMPHRSPGAPSRRVRPKPALHYPGPRRGQQAGLRLGRRLLRRRWRRVAAGAGGHGILPAGWDLADCGERRRARDPAGPDLLRRAARGLATRAFGGPPWGEGAGYQDDRSRGVRCKHVGVNVGGQARPYVDTWQPIRDTNWVPSQSGGLSVDRLLPL